MRSQREFGGVVHWLLILLATCGLFASIMIPGRAMSRAEREKAQARSEMLDIVTAENRAYSERQEYIGTLDSLQLFIDWQTRRYRVVRDSLSTFFGPAEHPVEAVDRAAAMAGKFREYLQYIEDLAIKDSYVAIADSVYRFLRYQADIQAGAGEFRRLFDEVGDALQNDVLEPAQFIELAVKVDSLELVFRADPEQLAAHNAYREVLYLTRALLPARERFQTSLTTLDGYLESGERWPSALRSAARRADSLRFCFVFGGSADASEALESVSNFLDYRADLLERHEGYESLFGTVAEYLRDPQRDPEIAREMSNHADSLKYCFLFDSPGLLGVPLAQAEQGAAAEAAPVNRPLDLSQISNFLYGTASTWNSQLDSLTELVPETERRAHGAARAELKERFAEDQAPKYEKASAFAAALEKMRGELTAKLADLETDLAQQREEIPAIREALETRLAGGTTETATLAGLRESFETNLAGNQRRHDQLVAQIARLDPSHFPPGQLSTHSPAHPRAMYRLEIDGDKISVRSFHREEFGGIIEGDATW